MQEALQRHEVAPGFFVVEMDGHALRARPEAFFAHVKETVASGAAILAKGYLAGEEVAAVLGVARAMVRRVKAEWRPYRLSTPDFHHYDLNDAADNARRRAENRAMRPRRFHIFKFLPWNEHPEPFERAVRAVIALRNVFYGKPRAFGIDPGDGVFTVPQVVHYERGGDFLGEHSDADFHERQGLSTHLEIITLLSKKGRDFHEGGLFVRVGEEPVLLDAYADPGDLVIYDVRRPHGCAPVDPGLPKDPEGRLGRWMMLVPPYAVATHLRAD